MTLLIRSFLKTTFAVLCLVTLILILDSVPYYIGVSFFAAFLFCTLWAMLYHIEMDKKL